MFYHILLFYRANDNGVTATTAASISLRPLAVALFSLHMDPRGGTSSSLFFSLKEDEGWPDFLEQSASPAVLYYRVAAEGEVTEEG